MSSENIIKVTKDDNYTLINENETSQSKNSKLWKPLRDHKIRPTQQKQGKTLLTTSGRERRDICAFCIVFDFQGGNNTSEMKKSSRKQMASNVNGYRMALLSDKGAEGDQSSIVSNFFETICWLFFRRVC